MNILWLLIVVTAQSGKCSILNVLLFHFLFSDEHEKPVENDKPAEVDHEAGNDEIVDVSVKSA